MKTISSELHTALLQTLGQLPMAQVEQLVIGLRQAVDVPAELAEQINARQRDRVRKQLAQQLAQLEAPPSSSGNGKGAEA